MPNVPYPYEVNDKLVTGNGSLTTICSLSKRSLSPSLTLFEFHFTLFYQISLTWTVSHELGWVHYYSFGACCAWLAQTSKKRSHKTWNFFQGPMA